MALENVGNTQTQSQVEGQLGDLDMAIEGLRSQISELNERLEKVLSPMDTYNDASIIQKDPCTPKGMLVPLAERLSTLTARANDLQKTLIGIIRRCEL